MTRTAEFTVTGPAHQVAQTTLPLGLGQVTGRPTLVMRPPVSQQVYSRPTSR